jgi:V8-like Glu-specific endopeptidase
MAACLVVPATALALGLRIRLHVRSTAAGTAATMPSSQTTNGVPQIGALFANETTRQHSCTAGVVDSSAGNVLITAAHCVAGSGAGMVFVPALDGAGAPFGRWTVTAAYVPAGWRARQDPEDDVAFLTVAPRRGNGALTNIQAVTGGYRLGSAGAAGQSISVTAYPAGSTSPIACTTKVYFTAGFPSFNCRGYVGGTSGTPWIRATSAGAEIVGVIGGLHQGGCVDYVSYSAPLGGGADDAFQRATAAAPGDFDPPAGSDGCG